MPQPIKVAVLPVAGLGTRFLPATKSSAKEMLPIVDQPLIAHVVNEAVAAGIEKIVFVTAMGKRSIEDYFDRNTSLEQHLEAANKHTLLQRLHNITPTHVHFVYVRQHQALGLGHAVLCAQPVVGHEPFAVLLADDLIEETQDGYCLTQMMAAYQTHQGHVIAHEAVPADQVSQYGILELDDPETSLSRLRGIIEKPAIGEAPSNRAVIGRYVLDPSIFDALASQGQGAGNEIQLTDAIAATLPFTQAFGYRLEGTRFDCGSKLGYMKANVHYALRHPEIGQAFADYLSTVTDHATVL